MEDDKYFWEEWAREKAVWQQLKAELEAGRLKGNGRLPDCFSEMMRLIDPESEEGTKFQAYMEGLTLKLLPGWDFKAHPIRFFIADTEEVNAAVIAAHQPALMFFNKGLLQLVGDNENMLLHVLGHELGHELFREAVGNVRVSKPEEMLVSMPAIQWMHENGINPMPAVDFALKISELDKKERGYFPGKEKGIDALMDIAIAVADEHLTPAFDLDLINNALVAYRNQVAGGFQDRKMLKIPEEMQEIFQDAVHVPHVERALEQLPTPFDKMAWPDQLGFIRDQAAAIGNGFARSRAEDLLELLESVDNPVNDVSRTLGSELVAALKNEPVAFLKLIGAINTNLMNQDENLPVAPMTDLIPLMKAVPSAQNYEDFCHTTKAMMKEVNSLLPYPLEIMKWPAIFKMPSDVELINAGRNGMPPPWDQQVGWAMQALKEGNEDPARAMILLGVEDSRLYEALPLQLLEEVFEGCEVNAFIVLIMKV